MNSESIFEKVKQAAQIADVVERFGGLKLDCKGKSCCPFHSEKTASFSVKKNDNIFKCFGCGESGDAIDFVAKLKGVEPLDAAKLLAEYYGIDTTAHGGQRTVDKILTAVNKTRPGAPQRATAQIREYVTACIAAVGRTDYFKLRGLTEDTIAKFRLGFDEQRQAVVIPYSSKLDYYQTRSIVDKKFFKPRTEDAGAEPLYHGDALKKGGVIFVVESPICALSIMQAGGEAIAICGTSGTGKLVAEVEATKPQCVFVLCLDNDKAGRQAQDDLEKRLTELGARVLPFNIAGECKDPNELLMKDAAALAANIKAATEAAEKVEAKKPTSTKAEQVKALLEKDITDPKAVFAPEYIDALIYAREHLPAEYSVFKIRAKAAKVPLRDLETTLAQYAKKNKPQGEGGAGEPPLDLGGKDLNGAVAPKGWTITIEGGVRKIYITRDGDKEIIACPDAVVITARLVNAEDGKERLELSFYKDGAWKKLIGARTQVYNRTLIMAFGDDGLHITSESAKDLVVYLSEYEQQNKKAIPLKKSVARVGWINASQFFPFATDEQYVFEENGGATIFHNIKEQGDYAAWKELMARLRKNPYARFITAASFASPLLLKMGVRPFAIHIWHDSASGKSAVLKAAISVWGNPDKIMLTPWATPVGIEQHTGTLNNLPLGIDEKQAADENKMPLGRLIYMLGEGEGKTRGAKGGGNAEKVTWHNIVIITGEEPITSKVSKDGIQTRTLELNARPVDEMDFASEVHTFTEKNYGYAGAAFMRAICERLKAEPEFLVRKYTDVHEALKAKGFKGVHSEFIAAVIVADYLAETLIFGTDTQTAETESFKIGTEIFAHNAEQLHCDNVESAFKFTVGWLASNSGRFQENSDSAMPCYGKKQDAGEKTTYYVIPLYLDNALTEEGYNTEKVTRGFAEKGYLYTFTDATGKKRKKQQITFNGVRTEAYRFDLDKNAPKPEPLRIVDLVPIEDGEDLPF